MEVNMVNGVMPITGYSTGAMDNIDMISNSYNYYPSTMNSSIFGGGYMPYYGMNGGYNAQEYYDYMRNNQKFYADYNVDQNKLNRNSDLRINGSIEAVKGAAMILKDKVTQNEQDQIMQAYENYEQAVRLAYGDASDTEVRARALTLYAQMNGGKSLYQDLRENANGSATQGFIQSLTFGLYDRHSAEDNISEISHAPVGTGEKVKQNLGRIAGAGAIAAVGRIVGSFFGPVGKVVGTAAGAVAGLLSFITGKVTT